MRWVWGAVGRAVWGGMLLLAAMLTAAAVPGGLRAAVRAEAGPAARDESIQAGGDLGAGTSVGGGYVGFDRNDYPGDALLPALRRHFAFAGYWLTDPPGETGNSWVGKRAAVRAAGFGFLVLANGKLDAEILKAGKAGTGPEALGRRDAALAVAAARREGFPAGTIVFLDQEQGGRLLAEQAAYLLAWTEAMAKSGYAPGVYGSGQPVDDGPKPGGGRATITTAEDIRARVKAGGLHEVVLWVAQDACPPANGCVAQPPPIEASGTAGAAVWQYAQSPRRPEITKACARSYAPDGKCYVPGSSGPEFKGMDVDLDLARTADPSRGR